MHRWEVSFGPALSSNSFVLFVCSWLPSRGRTPRQHAARQDSLTQQVVCNTTRLKRLMMKPVEVLSPYIEAIVCGGSLRKPATRSRLGK